jgi:hypothetical protein
MIATSIVTRMFLPNCKTHTGKDSGAGMIARWSISSAPTTIMITTDTDGSLSIPF